MRRSIGGRRLRISLAALACSLTACTQGAKPAGGSVATALVFSVQPPRSVARAALPTAVQVRGVDARGQTVAAEARAVTLSLHGGTPGATLGGTVTVAMVGGVATFPGLAVSQAGTGYSLVATCTGLSSATSAPFDVDPALLTWDSGVMDQDLWQ